METGRNLPADLPTLAREIELVVVREREIVTEINKRDQALMRDFDQKRKALIEEAEARHHPNRIELDTC